jgi:hypothetical protein
MVSSASVSEMPAFTNTASCRVKCINSFFFTFLAVSSTLKALFFSVIFTGNKFFSRMWLRASPSVSALMTPSVEAPLTSMAV